LAAAVENCPFAALIADRTPSARAPPIRHAQRMKKVVQDLLRFTTVMGSLRI
jgi:hypothetical protein